MLPTTGSVTLVKMIPRSGPPPLGTAIVFPLIAIVPGPVTESNRIPVAPPVLSKIELPLSATDALGPSENSIPVPWAPPNCTSLFASVMDEGPAVIR